MPIFTLFVWHLFISFVKSPILTKLYEIYLFIHCLYIQIHFRTMPENAVRMRVLR